MKKSSKVPSTVVLVCSLVVSGCSSPDVVLVRPASSYQGIQQSRIGYDSYGRPVTTVYASGSGGSSSSSTKLVSYQHPEGTRMSPSTLLAQARLKVDYLPTSARGRTGKSMRPRYITIHSTQNWSAGADPWRHSLALKRGKLGSLSWHFTVDENVAVQHLPTTEQGRHADINGPGNHYSIGIEMCEHPGNSRAATLERTAKLTAWLMHKHGIPLSQVVPHYHWPRWGRNPPNKNCPHFLLDNGKPGRKWNAYLAQIKKYHDAITLPQSNAWASR